LDDLSKRLSAVTMATKDQTVASLLREGYVPRFFELFRQAEREQKLDPLHHLFTIFKAVFLLNDCNILEVLLNEEQCPNVVACLEYDPELPQGTSHTRHRDFMAK
jgi:hypothetical protein